MQRKKAKGGDTPPPLRPTPTPSGKIVYTRTSYSPKALHTYHHLSVNVVVVVKNALSNDFFSSHSRPKTRVLTGLDGSDSAEPFL